MVQDRRTELRDPLVTERGRLKDRRFPRAGRAQVQHLTELPDHLAGPIPVGLVHDEDVCDLQDAGLGHLNRIAHPRGEHDHGRIGGRGHLDLGLADAHGLHHDLVVRGGVQHANGLRRRERHAPQMSTGGHRTDEDARIGRVLLHADAVPQQRPAGVRGGGIDREHRDVRPASRSARTSSVASVDFPTPGAPVSPIVDAAPVLA